jgi:hypothetical protein
VGNVGGLNGSVVEVENNVKVFGHLIHFVSKMFLQKINPHLREHGLDWIGLAVQITQLNSPSYRNLRYIETQT